MGAQGVLPRLIAGWRRPGATILSLRGMSEAGLLALLMATMAVFMAAQWPVNTRMAQLDPSVPLDARMGGSLLAVMIIMPLFVYALAGFMQLLARIVRLPIDGHDARLALIWTLAMIAPLMLLGGLVAGLIGPSTGLSVVNALTGVAFLAFLALHVRALSAARRAAPQT